MTLGAPLRCLVWHSREVASVIHLLSLETAFPEKSYTQDEILDQAKSPADSFARKVAARSGISARQFVHPVSLMQLMYQPALQAAVAETGSRTLAFEAAAKALAGMKPESIDAVVVATSSYLACPSLAVQLVAAFGLRADVVKYDLVGHACVGAMTALSSAYDYLSSHHDARVLVVCVENGLMTLRPDSDDRAQVIASSLFGDGAAALVLESGDRPKGLGRLLKVAAHQASHALEAAALHRESTGARAIYLSRDLPEMAAAEAPTLLKQLLGERDPSSIRHWALHPGGRAVLDRLQERLGLDDDQIAPGRRTLREHGNVSGPSCLVSLKTILASGKVEGTEEALALAFGPGFSVGGALFKLYQEVIC